MGSRKTVVDRVHLRGVGRGRSGASLRLERETGGDRIVLAIPAETADRFVASGDLALEGVRNLDGYVRNLNEDLFGGWPEVEVVSGRASFLLSLPPALIDRFGLRVNDRLRVRAAKIDALPRWHPVLAQGRPEISVVGR